jgi:hypothetical protein
MIKTLLFLAASTLAASASLSFDEAKARADRDEAALTGAQTQALMKSQGEVLGPAMQACAQRFGPPPDYFVVVLKLDAQGRVVESWNRGGAFAACFEAGFKGAKLVVPAGAEFYTSLEITMEPEAPAPQPMI